MVAARKREPRCSCLLAADAALLHHPRDEVIGILHKPSISVSTITTARRVFEPALGEEVGEDTARHDSKRCAVRECNLHDITSRFVRVEPSDECYRPPHLLWPTAAATLLVLMLRRRRRRRRRRRLLPHRVLLFPHLHFLRH